ncbi:MAG: ABC transporter permease [candidate division Zixibacteria bacterium]|nr:ABC transporter permease [candidate division Zixibacteria bacterium]
MNFRKVKIIYFKEVLETLRDRRTLISTILIPIILFPVLMFGMSAVVVMMMKKTEAEATKIAVIGEEFAHSFVSVLLKGDDFQKVDVEDFKSALKEKEIHAALEFPSGFEEKLKLGENSEATIYYDGAEIRSSIAKEKLSGELKDYQDSLVAERLRERNIERSILHPIKINSENLAPKEKMGGFMLGMFLPYMIVILAMVGAMYPAIDLTAGEKERGTLETILVTPVSRLDIATGKFLTVMTASVITIILATASMSLTASLGFAQIGEFASEQISFAIKPLSIVLLLLLMLPLAALFSSALLSVSLFAKSYKEAQSYVSPLMFVVILPAMVSFIPGIELNWGLAFVPIVNISLAAREVLLGTFRWEFIGLIFVSTFIYASFSIFVTKRLFEKEEVLFRT